LGLTGARAATLAHVAAVLADGLDVGPGADRAAARSALHAVPGIGPWTVEYVALRAMGDPDAFPAHDLVLRQALGGVSAAEALARAEHWRPWRGYAAQHLWTSRALTLEDA
ncbi:3-methyladenine DNA glycosylase 2, partial [Actinotalea ferrariae]|uniref:DNA-3-methyladenine glycosylase family protein n=1 Tax=Actinotalea ferrariae TaxID=1386098 RepID=UPI001EC6D0C8|nr:3-methyladenine DNA glycosylase 2 [Actinotalea ferrariae]